MSNNNQYEQLSKYLNKQIDKINDSINQPEIVSNIPPNVLKLIQQRVEEKRKEKITQVAKDIVTQRVYDMEYDRNVEERKEIIKMIHTRNIAKNSMNAQFLDKNNSEDINYNLDYLINNIYKLPELVTTRHHILITEDNDSNDKDTEKKLKEYMILREELINHCNAIRIGQEELDKLKLQYDKLESLRNAIIDNTGSDNIAEYIQSYNGKIMDELKELTYLLEEKIKTIDPKDTKQIKKLQSMLDDLM